MSGRTLFGSPHTSGTPSIIMSPDHCPWTQIRPGAGTRNASPAPRFLTGGRICLEPQTLCLVPRRRVCGGPSSASRSFVLAALRARHLDPDCGPPRPSTGRERRPNNVETTNGHLYRGSSTQIRSFVLAALRALHLDPDCGPPRSSTGRERRPNNVETTNGHLYRGSSTQIRAGLLGASVKGNRNSDRRARSNSA
jgi:hypothetical protein